MSMIRIKVFYLDNPATKEEDLKTKESFLV